MKRIMSAFVTFFCFLSLHCFADWNLQPERSQLNLVSVKNAAIAEVHHFTQLGGHIDVKGQVSVAIDLASIETQIPIRNERMKTMLFDTANFAASNISAQVDVAMLMVMQPGQQASIVLPCKVQLHGKQKTLDVAVSVIALANAELAVSKERDDLAIQALEEKAKKEEMKENFQMKRNLFLSISGFHILMIPVTARLNYWLSMAQ